MGCSPIPSPALMSGLWDTAEARYRVGKREREEDREGEGKRKKRERGREGKERETKKHVTYYSKHN